LSFEGAAWHAKNLALIEHDDADEMVRHPENVDVGAFDEPLTRKDPVNFGLCASVSALANGLLSDRVCQAYSEGLLSKARAEEILSLG
jgi:hypothetical protein